jgi:CheY-like chemotaxis protein
MSANDPAWRSVQDCQSAAPNPDPEALIEQRYRGRRVLIVDDEPMNRGMLQIILNFAGLVTDTVDDGAQAIAQAWRVHYDLILMDMQMPNVDGLEATRKILEIPGYRQIPIIAMTANCSAEARGLCLASGMSDYMTKPFDPQRLFAKLLHWLSLGNQPHPSSLSPDRRPTS